VTDYFDCADPLLRERGLRFAMVAVHRGELVVLPTDTVYGVGADAFSAAAVAGLLAAKGRGRDLPVPVLVDSAQLLAGLAATVPAAADRLAEAFWPGPLTIVVRQSPHLAWDLGETRGTVAVRMPAHPLALELLASTGPLAVSSANRTGEPPAQTATDARAQLGDSVAVYLDAGPTPGAVPSTIVDLTDERPRLLRLGTIGLTELRAVLPDVRAGDVAG
jgi:L-threonylcarbamoyladenylate synthase